MESLPVESYKLSDENKSFECDQPLLPEFDSLKEQTEGQFKLYNSSLN